MASAVALIDILKRELKSRGVTYAQVAKTLELSEASVKRLFSRKDFTLERLDAICAMAGIDFGELARTQGQDEHLVSVLTLEQEQQIVADNKLLIVAVCALSHWQFEQLIAAYHFTEAELIRQLTRLDRLKIIELLPNNKIRPLITRAFTWIPDGPIHKYFKAVVSRDYLDSSFDSVGEVMVLVNGMLSDATRAAVATRLRQVANEFRELHHDDMHLPLDDKSGTSMLVAVRKWEPKFFSAVRRQSGPTARIVRATRREQPENDD
jgi:AcrR family transcriptional regulator